MMQLTFTAAQAAEWSVVGRVVLAAGLADTASGIAA
jgi:hypothetical protein